jgi:hypothetical protein
VERKKKRGEPFNPFASDAVEKRIQRKYGIKGAQQKLKDYESDRLSKLHDLIESLVIPPFGSDYPGRLKALKEMIRGTKKKYTPTVLDKKRKEVPTRISDENHDNAGTQRFKENRLGERLDKGQKKYKDYKKKGKKSQPQTDLDKKRKEALTRMSDAKPSGASGISKQNQQQQSAEETSSREDRLTELRKKSAASMLNAKPRSEPAPYRPVTKLSERKQYEVDIIDKLKNNGSPYLGKAESIAEHLSRVRKMRKDTKNPGKKKKYKKLINEYRNQFDQIANTIKD